MKQNKIQKKIEERLTQTMTVAEVLEMLDKAIDEATEGIDGGGYAYGRQQALKDFRHTILWDGIDLND